MTAAGAVALAALAVITGACSSRRGDDMKPLGETVEVVIPASDVQADSAIAAGATVDRTVEEDI